jgi:mono/diheme cytochrome c family protein
MKKFIIISTLALAFGISSVVILAPKTENDAYSQPTLKARAIYKGNCIMCHGKYGEGNGATVRALPVKPPNWNNSGWQTAVTDTGIKNVILGGGKAIGRSDYMPAFPHLENTEEIDALVSYVRELGRR